MKNIVVSQIFCMGCLMEKYTWDIHIKVSIGKKEEIGKRNLGSIWANVLYEWRCIRGGETNFSEDKRGN